MLRRDRLPPVAPDDGRRRLFVPRDADCCDGMLLCFPVVFAPLNAVWARWCGTDSWNTTIGTNCKSWRLETRLGPRTPQLRRLKNLPQDVRARLFTQCKLLLIYTLLVLGVVWEQQRARNTGTSSVSSGTLAHDVTCRFRVLYQSFRFRSLIVHRSFHATSSLNWWGANEPDTSRYSCCDPSHYPLFCYLWSIAQKFCWRGGDLGI